MLKDWAPQPDALLQAFLYDANSIFYYPYIVCCFLITFGTLYFAQKYSLKDSIKTMLDKKIWLTKSTLTDMVVTIVYLALFNAPTNLVQAGIMGTTYYFLGQQLVDMGARELVTFSMGPLPEAIIACAITMLTFDFATYVAHRIMHKVPMLWDIHLVHHSPETLNIFSAYRQNPLDRLIRNSTAGLFMGIGLAVFHVFFPASVMEYKILGVGAGFFFVLFTVHLQHSHVPVHYPKWLQPILLSPHLHQIHHSVAERHHDKNFASIFPYWDKMFGTYYDEQLDIKTVKFGLGKEDPIGHKIWRCYLYPVVNLPNRLQQLWWKRRAANKAVSEPAAHEPPSASIRPSA